MGIFAVLVAIGMTPLLPPGEEAGLKEAWAGSPVLAFGLPEGFGERSLEESPLGLWDPADLVPFRDFREPLSAPRFSVVAETGTYLKSLRFNAVREDGAPRTISGIGLIPIEVEGSYQIGSQWSVGLGALGAFSQNVEVWGVGPQVMWRFWAGHAASPTKPPETEHFLKAGVFWEGFAVSEPGFGTFKSTAAPQIGYQFRTPLGGEGWTFQVELRYEYAAFRFNEPVFSGNRAINGNGLFFGIGAGILF